MSVAELFEAEPAPVRRTRALMRGLALASVLLLVLSVVGLAVHRAAPAGPDQGALRTVSAAATTTAAARSARYATETSVSVAGTPTPVTKFTADGVFDFPNKRSSAHGQIGPLGSFDLLTLGTVEYVKLPDPTRKAAGVRTSWVSIDLAAAVDKTAGLGTARLPGSEDPLAALAQLQGQGVVKSVTKQGREQVRGVDTTHYKAVLDAQKVQDLANTLGGTLGASVTDKLKLEDPVLDLWIDGAGLVRRQQALSVSSFGGGGQSVRLESTTKTELFDFGTPVAIAAPPSTDVTQLGSLAQLFQLFRPGG